MSFVELAIPRPRRNTNFHSTHPPPALVLHTFVCGLPAVPLSLAQLRGHSSSEAPRSKVPCPCSARPLITSPVNEVEGRAAPTAPRARNAEGMHWKGGHPDTYGETLCHCRIQPVHKLRVVTRCRPRLAPLLFADCPRLAACMDGAGFRQLSQGFAAWGGP